MEAQPFWHLFFVPAWIFVSCLTSINSEPKPEIQLEHTVFVAFAGHDLHINSSLKIPPNQSHDFLTCSDPFYKQIYNCVVTVTNGDPFTFNQMLELKNLTRSGNYSCQYKTAKTFWFLRVREDGYKDLTDYTESSIIAVLAVLLVFSVVGSVYVFRGYWKVCSKKQKKEKKEVKEEKRASEDSVETITNPSSSCYASLEPRPRSIYDVLDRSAAKTEPDQSKAKPKKKGKKKKPQNMVTQTEPPQQEDMFESVYENF